MPAKAGIHASISGNSQSITMPIPRPPKQPCVYILASKRDGILYIGVTSNLANRVSLHKQDLIEGFTKRYGVHLLVVLRDASRRCPMRSAARSS